MAEKTRQLLNLSKANRVFEVVGPADKDGNPTTVRILPNQKPFEVPESEAVKLLAKLPNGNPVYPELVDASQFKPSVSQEKALQDALAENAKLKQENEGLRAQLSKTKGGKS